MKAAEYLPMENQLLNTLFQKDFPRQVNNHITLYIQKYGSDDSVA